MKQSIPLAIACGNYDRTRPLFDGHVLIEGCTPVFLPQSPEEIFFRAFVHEEFDVAELSLSSYVMRRAKGDCPYIGIPAFISRVFRHSAIYVRTDRHLARPQDLRGRLVGVPEYQQTAGVWVRGLLQDEYGVSPRDMRWVSGGGEMPGRVEKVPFTPPSGVALEAAPKGRTLSSMLEDGAIDALIAARPPSCFIRGSANVGRLFTNFGADEEDYYRRTGIFPIMHIVGIKTELVARHPWLPASIYKAFLGAKDLAIAALGDPNALSVSLPSLTWNAEQARGLMGKDFWPYGLEENARTLEVFLRYHFEQGLSSRRMTPGELFASSSVSQYKI
jgi:4,5-dihydroxyphthalate decarboxylase